MSESASSSRTYSSVWSHFTLLEEEGKAQCNYCGKLELEVENGEMDKFVIKEIPNFTSGSFREFLVKWIVCDDQLFVVVKCEYL
ncbi:uncharacterized protein OCT59_011094 [Rhizophagus irregularis]|uniref:BED-type domain-containing protein n=1 Tax=Rhizophagus irregularis (strain DAOM 181602 / DAOM 197198 / MUCL 43194) TaxID=747089 RepID=U9TVM8_RHIID|nr:hypothetical protein OCT59_011094 [Rhizophagus irregularis]